VEADARRGGARGNEDAAKLLETINDPKVAELYANPSKRMLAAHAEADKLGERGAEDLAAARRPPPQEAQLARYRHSRIAGGATVYDSQSARAAVRRIDGRSARSAAPASRSRRRRRLRDEGHAGARAAAQAGAQDRAQSARKTGTAGRADGGARAVDRLHARPRATNDQLLRLSSGKQLSSQELLDAGLKQGSDLPAFRARLTAAALRPRDTSLAGQYDRSLQQRRGGAHRRSVCRHTRS
jgi:hypothetical protein